MLLKSSVATPAQEVKRRRRGKCQLVAILE
jgi:hypothetical protein